MIHPERRRENLKKIEEMDRNNVSTELEDIQKHLDTGYSFAISWKSKLIRDAIILMEEQDAEIKRLKGELHGFGDLFHALSEKTEKAIAEQPDIVRCKECKHRSKELYDYYGNPNNKRYVCQIIDVAKKPDWFCGDGERGEPECEPEW